MPLLNVEIDEKLLREFRSFAAAKHGRLYNALRPEVETALRKHLDMQKTKVGCKKIGAASEQSEIGSDQPGGGSH